MLICEFCHKNTASIQVVIDDNYETEICQECVTTLRREVEVEIINQY